MAGKEIDFAAVKAALVATGQIPKTEKPEIIDPDNPELVRLQGDVWRHHGNHRRSDPNNVFWTPDKERYEREYREAVPRLRRMYGENNVILAEAVPSRGANESDAAHIRRDWVGVYVRQSAYERTDLGRPDQS